MNKPKLPSHPGMAPFDFDNHSIHEKKMSRGKFVCERGRS